MEKFNIVFQDEPWFQLPVVLGSLGAFLLYFAILRFLSPNQHSFLHMFNVHAHPSWQHLGKKMTGTKRLGKVCSINRPLERQWEGRRKRLEEASHITRGKAGTPRLSELARRSWGGLRGRRVKKWKSWHGRLPIVRREVGTAKHLRLDWRQHMQGEARQCYTCCSKHHLQAP